MREMKVEARGGVLLIELMRKKNQISRLHKKPTRLSLTCTARISVEWTSEKGKVREVATSLGDRFKRPLLVTRWKELHAPNVDGATRKA